MHSLCGIGCPRKRLAQRKARRAGLHTVDHPDILAVPHATAAPYITVVIALASAAVGAYASYQQGQQQAAVANYNAMLVQQQARQQAEYQNALAGYEAQTLERQAMGTEALAAQSQALTNLQLEAQVQAAETAGQIRESQIRKNYNTTQSQVRAAVGASGITDSSGSPLMVLLKNADTVGEELAINDYRTGLDVAGAKADASVANAQARTQATLQSQNLLDQAQLRRFGGSLTSQGILSQGAFTAQSLRFGASGARSAGMLNAGSILLGGFGTGASSLLRYGYGA